MDNKLTLLRNEMKTQGLDGFMLPVTDEFMNEYIPDCAKRLEWLTGFSGSAGFVIVTAQQAAFFTDGRYILQAKSQLSPKYQLHNSGELTPEKWLAESGKGIIGYDAKLHTLEMIRRYARGGGYELKAVPNLIDTLWHDRPAPPSSLVRIHPLEYTGEEAASKIARITHIMQQKSADALMLTAPDSICWLLNIRGDDIAYTPFALGYALLESNGNIRLYIEPERIKYPLEDKVSIIPPEQMLVDFTTLKQRKVMYDSANSPIWFFHELEASQALVMEAEDPCQLPKAIKNAIEIANMRKAHAQDGKALTSFLLWLEKQDTTSLSELSVTAKLESYRKENPDYTYPSFATICGSGANGAIVHYHATPESDKGIKNNSLLLIDSGGQYPQGTTDVTRTVAIGNLAQDMKRDFTLVLKGHIALAEAVFPQGTTGSQLDSLARQYLWSEGKDYDHGTGHGVGSFLSVHEGPQRISKRASTVALQAGMILSNEPGFYKTGEYGIRIENLVLVVEKFKNEAGVVYLGFETLTLAPIDEKAVDFSLLSEQEKAWLTEYNRKALDNFSKI